MRNQNIGDRQSLDEEQKRKRKMKKRRDAGNVGGSERKQKTRAAQKDVER